jgi:anthranilate synthase/aminodeoxychorismate synthase-like glutamine amidotransferase
MRILLIDNYDSFTYNLFDLLKVCDAECIVVKNDAVTIEAIETLNVDGIILSPGPKRPENAGITNATIRTLARKTPILGICLGHQAVGEFLGYNLTKAAQPRHGKTSLIQLSNHFLFENMPSTIRVMRYHSLLLSAVRPEHEIATSDSGETMAIADTTGYLCGIQYHPESVLSEYGEQTLKNWLAFVKKCRI